MPNPTCFVAMPLTTHEEDLELYAGDRVHFIHVLDHLFAPAIERAGFTVVRPVMRGADLIHAQIIEHLEKSDLVLCDISRHNPNVFFELGIRTALDRPVALVRDTTTKQLPFDTSSVNTHTYDALLAPWTIEREIADLASHIAESAKSAGGKNPLWQVFGLTKRAAEPSIEATPIDAKLDLLLQSMRMRDREEEERRFFREGLVSPHAFGSRSPSDSGSDADLQSGFSVGLDKPIVARLLDDVMQIAAREGVVIQPVVLGTTLLIRAPGGRLPKRVLDKLLQRALADGFRFEVEDS